MKAILKREFKAYFHTVIGWLYIGSTMALYGLYYFVYNLNYGDPKISYALNAITFLFLLTVPILTMRSLAEEQKSKTDQLILTAPVSVGKIVLAKYLAMAAIHTITVAFISLTPLILCAFGTVPLAESYVAVLGFWLYGLVCIAIGLFVSALTESQVIAAVLTFAFLFLGYMMSSITGLISSTGNVLTKLLGSYDLVTHLDTFMDGCLSITGMVYYLTVTALFLFLTAQAIQKRRWSITSKKIKTGVFSLGFVGIAIALTVVVNLFAGEIPSTYTAIDVTSNKLYSLTDDTKNYLKELKQDVTIYVIASEKTMDSTVAETLERYADSSSHIKVEYKDPAVSPTFFQNYTEESVSAGSLIVESGEISRVIDYSELFESTVDYSTYQQTVTGYDGEGQLTSAIQYVTSEDMPKVYAIEGHGETAISGNFSKAVEKANVTLESINLLQNEEVPEDAQAVIINGPNADFSKDDADKIIRYMQGGGNVLIALNYQAEGDMPNFNSILAEYGISGVKGLVAEGDANAYYQNPFYILPTVAQSDYTSSVGNNYVFVPYTQGVVFPEDTDTTTYTELLSTTEKAVAKTDAANAASYEFEEGDTKGPFSLAVSATRTIEEGKTGNLLVFGSSVFFTDDADSMVAGSNSGIFSNIISSFVDMEGMVTVVVPVKAYDATSLTIAASTSLLIGLGIIILLPVILLAAGIVIWAKRRKK